jgi:hypothetical protein
MEKSMLYSIDDVQNPIAKVPYLKEFKKRLSGLTKEQHNAIVEELNRKIEGTSSWFNLFQNKPIATSDVDRREISILTP